MAGQQIQNCLYILSQTSLAVREEKNQQNTKTLSDKSVKPFILCSFPWQCLLSRAALHWELLALSKDQAGMERTPLMGITGKPSPKSVSIAVGTAFHLYKKEENPSCKWGCRFGVGWSCSSPAVPLLCSCSDHWPGRH